MSDSSPHDQFAPVNPVVVQRFDYPRMVGDELGDTLSPALPRILGFNVRVPTSLDEYDLPADHRLYRATQG